MDPKTKAAFEKAATDFEARDQQRREVDEERVSDRRNFEQNWKAICQDVVVPALEQIGQQVLKPIGWSYEISSDPMWVTIQMYKGKIMAAGGLRRPYVTFVADSFALTINVSAASISHGGGERSHIPLEEISEDFVQQTVLKVFQRLAKGI
jgi:hypothetical protein